ncbi:hypothetical protein Lalb_Chr07g0193151 [Lupinus albus]|uniref:Uncharacterized protein n=1 Tax=Lupinus albus TaxID=3870 RepID=A0A6A4QAP8_LUPAL|nr:hypothetical protein Lalb_Chr07g0193151 [Lupinus albus]
MEAVMGVIIVVAELSIVHHRLTLRFVTAIGANYPTPLGLVNLCITLVIALCQINIV